jgi:hypothetical protein
MFYRNRFAQIIMGALLVIAGNASANADAPKDFSITSDTSQVLEPFKYITEGERCFGKDRQQGMMCRDDGANLYMYFTNYNSYHMGFMRYGFLKDDPRRTIGTNHSLGLTLTGGKYLKDGVVYQDGEDIRSIERFNDLEYIDPRELYAGKDMPGWISMFMGMQSATTPIPDLKGGNRFDVWIWYPADPSRYVRYSRVEKLKNAPAKTASWYPFIDDSRGGHYYHHITNRGYGNWIKASFDAHPTHHNAGLSSLVGALREGGTDAPGDGVDYFSRTTAFSLVFDHAKTQASPFELATDGWHVRHQAEENEETIANVAIGYDPYQRRFDISFEDKYRCGECNGKYQLRYSFEPITNDNIDSAKYVDKLENFFIEDDNDDNFIIKPNPGYNQVWASFDVTNEDHRRFLNGDTLYFSVQDLSERNFAYDARDDEIVKTSSGQYIKRRDLVKTISYDFKGYSSSPTITGHSYASTVVNMPVTVEYDLYDIWDSYDFNYDTDSSVDVTHEINNKTMKVTFTPHQIGEFKVSLSFKDSKGQLRVRKAFTLYSDPEDCRADPSCGEHLLVDFLVSDDASTLPVPSWQNIFHDVYSGYNDGGIGTNVGSNGDYNYQGISGDPIAFDSKDMLRIDIKNVGNLPELVKPEVSTDFDGRRYNGGSWTQLREQDIMPGKTISWYVPISEIASGTLDMINVHLPNDGQTLRLDSLSVITGQDGNLSDGNLSLVDFYYKDDKHLTEVDGWTSPFIHKYSGNKVGTVAIAVGKEGAYNHQGISGNNTLYGGVAKLEWVNHSSKSYTFSPMVTFNNTTSPSSSNSDDWFRTDEVTVPAKSKVIIDVPIPENGINIINVSVGINQPGDLGLNRITYHE